VTTEIVFHPDAALELQETTGRYTRRRSKVAALFAMEIEWALARIADTPRRWPSMDDKHRRLLVRYSPNLLEPT